MLAPCSAFDPFVERPIPGSSHSDGSVAARRRFDTAGLAMRFARAHLAGVALEFASGDSTRRTPGPRSDSTSTRLSRRQSERSGPSATPSVVRRIQSRNVRLEPHRPVVVIPTRSRLATNSRGQPASWQECRDDPRLNRGRSLGRRNRVRAGGRRTWSGTCRRRPPTWGCPRCDGDSVLPPGGGGT